MNPFKQTRLLTIYFLIVALDSISFSLLAPILAPLLAHNSIFFSAIASPLWRYVLYGFLIALFPLCYALSAPILGLFSDRFGRKPVILICLLLTLLAFISYIGAFQEKSIFLLAIGRILAGIGGASECTAQAAVIDIAESKFKPNVVSLIAVGMTIGLAIGPLIASVWTNQTSTAVFAAIIGLTLLNILLLSLFITNTLPTASASYAPAWPFLWKQKNLLPLLMIFFLFELGWSLYYQALPLALSTRWNCDSHQVGLISAYVGAALTLLLAISTRISLRFLSANNIVKLSILMGCAALFASLFKISLFPFLLYSLPIILAVALAYPCLIAELSDLANTHQGFVIGIAGALLSFAFAISSFVSSLLVYINQSLLYFIVLIFWASALFWYSHLKKYS